MSRYTFRLPDLGEGLVEATVLEWLVAPDDTTERNDPVAEVETTKSTVELTAPVAGRVVELHAEPGETVAVGAALMTFETTDQAGIVGTVPADERPTRRVRLRPPEG
jgi:pyruvate dehydrogenase E2 component (dihydrolipoamide acetyltransferase)